MAKKIERLEQQRKIVASRLKERLLDNKMTQSDLLRKTKLLFGYTMTPAQMSQTLSGKRTLQNDFARFFADVLDTDSGYFLGSDNFIAKDYDSFLSFYRNYNDEFFGEEYEREKREFERFDYLLNMVNFKVVDMSLVDNTVTDYGVRHNGITARIPSDEMHKFEEEIKDYIKIKLAPLMKRYIEEA